MGGGGKGGGGLEFSGVGEIHEPDLSHLVSNVRKINRKTGQLEDKYPKYLRAAKYACMLSVVGVLLTGVVLAFIYFFLINVLAEYWNCSHGKFFSIM